MATQISPMLAVTDGSAAIEFYKAAIGAQLLWKLGEGADVVAGLSIDGAPFFLAHHAPEYGTRGPSLVGFTTVRIELFVENPAETHGMAVEAGATEHSPIEEHEHPTWGPKPIRRMLQVPRLAMTLVRVSVSAPRIFRDDDPSLPYRTFKP